MSQFFAQGLLKPQYFNAQYLRGAEAFEQTGRSGYWRLFFMKMQEEALAPAKKAVVEAMQEMVGRGEQPATRKPAKKRPRLPKLVPLEIYELPNFKRKPIYTTPTSVNPTLPAWLTLVSQEVDQWYASIIPLWKEHKRFIIVQQQTAANDADYRRRLLLLLAA